jgi:protein-disulfide isomerase
MGKDRVDSGRGERPAVVKAGKSGGRPPASGKWFRLAIVGVIIVGVAVLAAVAARSRGGGPVTLDPNLTPVTSDGYVMGSPDAPIEVIEFLDFECPACAMFGTLTAPDVKARLVNTGQIRYRVFDFPLPQHKNAWTASFAAACAADQGKFWEMHDEIFMAQDRWATEATRNPLGVLEPGARRIGLDVRGWRECIEDRRHQPRIQAHMEVANRYGVQSTPSFVIGGRLYPGALSYDRFKLLVDSAIATARTTGESAPADTAAR